MVRRLLYLNGLAIISVVLYHASTWGFISMFWWAHRYRPVGEVNFDQFGNAEYYGLRIIEQLIIFAIPAFVFVSGYFIAVAAGRENKTLRWIIVLNRIKLLAIPFVIWSVVSILFSMMQGTQYTPIEFFLTIVLGDASGPFYFIPMLIQLYLISPILLLFVRKQWKLVLTISAVIQIIIISVRYISIFNPHSNLFSSISSSVLFTTHIFWFISGVVVGLHFTQFKSTLVKYQRWFLFGILFFFIAGVVEWEVLFRLSGQDWIQKRDTLVDQFYALFVILSFLSFDKTRLPFFGQVTGMGARSYAIYLTHTLILISTAKIIYRVSPSVMEYQILFQPILIFMGLGIPLLLTKVAEWTFFRPYYRFVFG